MVVELALRDFLGCLHDQRRAFGIEQTEIVIRLRSRPFDQAQSANKRPRKSITAYRKIQDRACADAGSDISPIESFSIRVGLSVMPNDPRKRLPIAAVWFDTCDH